jgi:hypothetical protein
MDHLEGHKLDNDDDVREVWKVIKAMSKKKEKAAALPFNL